VVDGRSSVVVLLQCFIKAREFAVEASGAFTTRSFTVHREDSKILRRKASGVNNRVGKDCKKENIRGTVISRQADTSDGIDSLIVGREWVCASKACEQFLWRVRCIYGDEQSLQIQHESA
jgi:hypothetical protein